jgi:hypothetical protein
MHFVSIFVNFISTPSTFSATNDNNGGSVDVDFIFDSILKDYSDSPLALDFCARKPLMKHSPRMQGNYEGTTMMLI